MRSLKLPANRTGVVALLEDCLRCGGTDIHLKAPGRPQVRVGDRLLPTSHDRVSATDTHSLLMTLAEMGGGERPLAQLRETRFAFGVEGLGRFRVQAVRQRGSWGLVIHVMATEAPSLGSLGLDGRAATLVEAPSGMVLVGGSRQRYAVLAALARQYNTSVPGHLLTIEDPLDYLHKDLRASITQREVGEDVDSIAQGLMAAPRLDPDAILVTDVPDATAAEQLLRQAEAGLLVVAGLAAPDASDVVTTFVHRLGGSEKDGYERVHAVLRGAVLAPRVGPALVVPVPGAPETCDDDPYATVA